MSELIALRPVAHVRGGRAEPVDDDWDGEEARIVLDHAYGEDAFAGLAEFSHVEIVFHFDRVAEDRIEMGARRPRAREDWPLVGIFAQRGKNRPNRLGVSVCRLDRVEGRVLHVHGLDAIDGTPVLDIKPVMREFAPRGPVRQPAWATELMAGYWNRVGV